MALLGNGGSAEATESLARSAASLVWCRFGARMKHPPPITPSHTLQSSPPLTSWSSPENDVPLLPARDIVPDLPGDPGPIGPHSLAATWAIAFKMCYTPNTNTLETCVVGLAKEGSDSKEA